MIKATGGSTDGRPLMILGLSRQNTERLLAGMPIAVLTHEVDPRLPDMRIVLMAGETEDDMAAELRRFAR